MFFCTVTRHHASQPISYTGTLTEDTLTLVVPSFTGELETIEYRRASIAEYNQAARAFRERIENEAAVWAATEVAIMATATAIQEAQEVSYATATAEAQYEATLRGWEEAHSQLESSLEGLSVPPRNVWFTAKDESWIGGIVAGVHAMMPDIRALAKSGDCAEVDYQIGEIDYQIGELDYAAGEIEYEVTNIEEHLTEMQEYRDALGERAPEHVRQMTEDLVKRTRERIALANEQYEKATQILVSLSKEASNLECTERSDW